MSDRAVVPAKENLFHSFLKLVKEFYHGDLEKFCQDHDRLFKQAKKTNDYSLVASHFYSVMARVIEVYYGGSFHFVPPEFAKQTRKDSEKFLHHTIARLLNLEVGKTCLDIGCGIGGTMSNVARYSGARMLGIAVGPNEVVRGNELFAQNGLQTQCDILHGDCHTIPFPDSSFDSSYAVYALKYFPDVEPVFDEVHRILKPGGLFLVYDLIKTDKYSAANPEHRNLVEKLEYCCGMPPLHSIKNMIDAANQSGLKTVCQMDLQTDPNLPWYEAFIHSPYLMWTMESLVFDYLIVAGEKAGILPTGFHQFNSIFFSGIVTSLVHCGRKGIVSGSNVLVFKKP